MPNVDEIAHLPAGVSHWKFEKFDLYRVNPPLVRMVGSWPASVADIEYDWSLYSRAVGQRPEFNIGGAALSEDGVGLARKYYLPRLMTILVFYLGIMCVVHQMGPFRGLGWLPACVSTYWASSPELLAHAPTIGPDFGAAAIGYTCSLAGWKYLTAPSLRSAMWAGVALGMSLLDRCLFTQIPPQVVIPL